MNARRTIARFALPMAITVSLTASALEADSYIADGWKHAWGENVGWSNWADANGRAQGVEVYQNGPDQYLKGWIWFENIGWANVGNGGPYPIPEDQNGTDANGWGVNIDPTTGDMTGFAWSENAGWIKFGPFPPDSDADSAQWDHATFSSHGWAWGENIGWINLEDSIHHVCAIPGDFDYDGDVDVLDFSVFASGFGSTGSAAFTLGDCDGDGDTDIFDFGAFAVHFGAACAP